MANIPLRTYEKKIEELVGQNLLQEAVVHCKHILKSYPKNISTYRLLGQAFLEAKQYIETADVFKRVLTVFPDDFISHVGMSIVRENENNLDAAIWHMELAFDNQPSNITIQEELKRLFGRRDGTHPAKIRLTRGALVRMYARGELYQQAIAEIKSALSEEVKRLDLEVFLAKMFYLSGDQENAIELCKKLIVELPYCFEINKILSETSIGDQSGKANIFKERLIELDAYEGFVSPKFPTTVSIPDDKVTLEELSDNSVEEMVKDTSWMNDLDDEWGNTPSISGDEGITSLLNPDRKVELPPREDQFTVTNSANESAIPNPFMQGQIEGSDQPASQWAKPDDWLPTSQETSHSEVSSDSQPSESPLSEDLPDWLNSLVSPETPGTKDSSEDLAAEQPFVGNDQPSLTSASKEASLETKPEVFSGDNLEKTDSADTDLPDWLKNFETEKAAEPVSKDDLPDWLNSLQNTNVRPAESISPVIETGLESTSVDNGIADAADTQSAFIPAPVSEEEEIQSPAAFPAEEIEEIEKNQEAQPSMENTEEIPDWIRALQEPDAQDQDKPVTPEMESELGLNPEQLEAPASSSETASTEAPISEKTGDELLEWLRDLKPEDNLSVFPEDGDSQDIHINTESLAYDFDAELKKFSQISPEETPKSEIIDDFDLSSQDSSGQPIIEKENQVNNASMPDFLQSFVEGKDNEPTLEPLVSSELLEDKVEQTTNIPVSFLDDSDITTLSNVLSSGGEILPIVQRLQTLSQENPNDHLTWQLLGDAYARMNQYSDALSAYNRAEQILINQK